MLLLLPAAAAAGGVPCLPAALPVCVRIDSTGRFIGLVDSQPPGRFNQ